jgi:hypothetical protein
MSLLVGLALLALLFLPLGLAIRQGTELFRFEIENRKARLLGGRLPPRLWHEIEDVARRFDGSARFRVAVENRRARVVALRGNVSDGDLQRLRNVIGRFEVPVIRRGTKRA